MRQKSGNPQPLACSVLFDPATALLAAAGLSTDAGAGAVLGRVNLGTNYFPRVVVGHGIV